MSLPPFDDLVNLSEEELEKVRQKHIKEIIDSADNEDQRRKLQGLQFKIDMIRRKHKNPMGACIEISKMMHDSFLQLRDALKEAQENHINHLQNLKRGLPVNSSKTEDVKEVVDNVAGKVLDFRKKDEPKL